MEDTQNKASSPVKLSWKIKRAYYRVDQALNTIGNALHPHRIRRFLRRTVLPSYIGFGLFMKDAADYEKKGTLYIPPKEENIYVHKLVVDTLPKLKQNVLWKTLYNNLLQAYAMDIYHLPSVSIKKKHETLSDLADNPKYARLCKTVAALTKAVDKKKVQSPPILPVQAQIHSTPHITRVKHQVFIKNTEHARD